ncbi:MAG: HAD-IA family hydrolase [Planctomycetota bacterium]|nr:HAD-IA family hydrolase [Planctomycetota bacterium]MDI6787510.1 HAD-IA family hydrolase [Planctomycetota bacterium]
MSALKAIFFDIDDTLYSTSLFASRARYNSIKAMISLGLNLPEKILLKELEEAIKEFSSNYEHHFDKLLLRIPKRSYEGINPSMLVAAAVIAYHETKSRELLPFSDVPPVLETLSNTDLIRGVITDGLAIKQSEKLIRLKLYHLFTPRAIFISDEIGISKPNIKLYQRVCNELNLPPDEVMYVGDNSINDIDPAKTVGMITVLSRRVRKHHLRQGRLKPDYQIDNFRQLLKIVSRMQ